MSNSKKVARNERRKKKIVSHGETLKYLLLLIAVNFLNLRVEITAIKLLMNPNEQKIT